MRSGKFIAAIAAALVLSFGYAGAAITPNTAYAGDFIAKCDGQQWFIDEVERVLNQQQASIVGLESSADLAIIKSIGLKGKGVSGTIPRAVGELKQLRYLFLADNELTGPIPRELYALPLLENIDLGGNRIEGGIPAAFGQMPALKILNLRANQFSGTIPNEILANTQLTFLDVSGNQLSGGLPVGCSQMTALQYLAVSDNPWGGAIPDLSALTNLKTLSAWNCKLTGTLPDSLYGMSTLQVLDLSGNSLSGPISPSIGSLTALQLLALGSNDLTGVIPAEIGSLAKLQSLDLSDNRLTGLIPDAFSAMEDAKEIHIENNRLRGLIPDSLKARSDAGTAVFAQDNYLTGETLKGLSHNERNFTDGAAAEQYRLAFSSSPLQIGKETTTNLYSYLQNKSLVSGNTMNKPLLSTDTYEITSSSAKAEVSADAQGLYVRALEDIKTSEHITAEIKIRDNTGSIYSKVSIVVTTETISQGGGGGGGSTSRPSTVKHEPYINGYPDKTFRASNSISREEVAKTLIASLQETLAENVMYTSYHDVDPARWSARYIERARKLGYLLGDTNGSFRPEANMTRAELSTCLVRVADVLGRKGTEEKTFSDVSGDAWYSDYVAKAAALGLVNGYPDDTFHPEASVTRAEAVTMVNRLLQRDPTTAAALKTIESPFTDTPRTSWDYLDILEASAAHEH